MYFGRDCAPLQGQVEGYGIFLSEHKWINGKNKKFLRAGFALKRKFGYICDT